MSEFGFQGASRTRKVKVTKGAQNVKTPTKLTGGTEKGNVVRGYNRTGRRVRQGASTANVTSNQQLGPNPRQNVTRYRSGNIVPSPGGALTITPPSKGGALTIQYEPYKPGPRSVKPDPFKRSGTVLSEGRQKFRTPSSDMMEKIQNWERSGATDGKASTPGPQTSRRGFSGPQSGLRGDVSTANEWVGRTGGGDGKPFRQGGGEYRRIPTDSGGPNKSSPLFDPATRKDVGNKVGAAMRFLRVLGPQIQNFALSGKLDVYALTTAGIINDVWNKPVGPVDEYGNPIDERLLMEASQSSDPAQAHQELMSGEWSDRKKEHILKNR